MSYICRIATLDEIISEYDEEIKKSIKDKDKLSEWKKIAIDRFNNGIAITYVGLLDDNIITTATATLDPSVVNNSDGLVNEKTAYLQGFRTKDEYQGQGYFSELFEYMTNDLKNRGYERVTLGVEEQETKNKLIYTKLGFTNLIKTVPDCYLDGTIVNVEYYSKDLK